MNFAAYIKDSMSLSSFQKLKAAFQSAKRFHFVERCPEDATGEELLIIAEHTGLSLKALLDDYKVASSTLGDREKDLYRKQSNNGINSIHSTGAAEINADSKPAAVTEAAAI